MFSRRREDELKREMDAHFAFEVEAEMERGLSPDEAAAIVRRRFGNRTRIAEDVRAAAGLPLLSSLLQDLRYGLRVLGRSPGFTAAAVLSLALAIGANTAIFSVLDALMLRPLPVRDPAHLVRLSTPITADFGFPAPFYDYFRQLSVFSDVAGIFTLDRSGIAWSGAVEPAPLTVALISENYFRTLGIAPAQGTGEGVVISWRYWERRFALAADVVGRSFTLNGVTHTVTGVMPRAFSGDIPGKPVDLWMPLTAAPQVIVEREDHRVPLLRMLARLSPGRSTEQARAALEVAYVEAVKAEQPQRLQQAWLRERVTLEPAGRGYAGPLAAFSQPLVILMAAVGGILLIACANLANLLLARAAARRGEISIRLSLGAGRGRILRQFLTEHLLLAALGGALALPLGRWSATMLVKFAGSGLVPLSLDVHLDARMLAFTCALCVLTGLLFGLVPAWQATARNHGRRLWVPRAPLVTQLSLSLAVLVGAGLLARTLHNLKTQDLGFHREHALLVWTAPEQAGRRGAEVARLFASVPERLSTVPGVVSASASLIGLLEGGYAPDNTRPTPNMIAPGYFETVGIRLLAGRNFSHRDSATAPPVAIINQAMARRQFADLNPVGKHFAFRRNEVEVVGVVSDARINTLRDGSRPMFYLPYTQQASSLFSMCVAVRTAGDSPALPALLRDAVHDVDRALPVLKIDTMEDQIDQSLLTERLFATLSSAFAVLAAILAAVGVYGVMAYATARQAQEFAIRMAVGATPAQLLASVLRECFALIAAGVACGVPLALAVARLLRARLFGVGPADPTTILAAIAALAVVTLAAALLPARRAALTSSFPPALP